MPQMLYFTSILQVILSTFRFFLEVHFKDGYLLKYDLQVTVLSEDSRVVESKRIGRKLVDKLYQTYSSELAGKRFAYDGEKSLYTVGPLPQNKFEFTIVLEDSFAKWYNLLLTGFRFCICQNLDVITFCHNSSLSGCETRSPDADGGPAETGKRTKCSFQSKTYKVELSYSAKIPLKSISLALEGVQSDNSTQDALRVLDIILRQQAANRYLIFFFFFGSRS